ADWIELELSMGEPFFSKATVVSIIRDTVGNEPSEPFVSDIWRQLVRRQQMYIEKFFYIQNDLMMRNDQVNDGRLEYEICLLFSLYGASNLTGSKPKLFERMAAEAIARHLKAEFFIFGWPVLPDLEAAIAERIKQVAKEL